MALLPRVSGHPVVPIAERAGFLLRDWSAWFTALTDKANAAPRQVQHLALTAQGAAIATASIPIALLTAGVYRISYTLRITRPATTSSEARVTFTWPSDTVTQTHTGTLVNGNLTTSRDQGSVIVKVDKDGPITYAVAYASVGGTSMQFEIDICVEGMPPA